MTKNKHSRVQRLEDKANIKGERRLVIPLCCFYGKEDSKCDCVPYYTREPQVIGKSMNEFYKEVNEPCKPMPEDAEPADWGEDRPSSEKDIRCQAV